MPELLKLLPERAESNQRYAFILTVLYVRQAWDSNNNCFYEKKTRVYLSKIERGGNLYYDAWTVRFTEDLTEAELFEDRDVVAIQKNLPFLAEVDWIRDLRTRCPKCGSLTSSKVDDDGALQHTCLKNSKHKVPPFTLFSKKK